MRSRDPARRTSVRPLRTAVHRVHAGRVLSDLQFHQPGRSRGMRELQREIPGTRDDWDLGPPLAGRRIAGRGVPAPDPAAEPGESEGPRWRGRRGAGLVPRVGRVGRRHGRVPLEARGTVRPDARTAEATPGADGRPNRSRPRSDQGPRVLDESARNPGAGRTQAADRGTPPGEGGHPEARRGPREHGEHVPEHPAVAAGRVEGPRDFVAGSDRRVPTGAGVPREGLRSTQGTGVGHRPQGGRVPLRHESGPRTTAGDREAGGAAARQRAPPRRTASCPERGGGGPRAQTVGAGTESERREARDEGGVHDHGPIGLRDRRAEESDGPARGADGAAHGRAEQTRGAAEGVAAPPGRTQGRDERRRRAARRSSAGQDPDLREFQEVRPVREDPRTPGAVTSMGLREKARKSLQGGAREEAEELDAPVMPKVDIAKIEAEGKAREDQLRRELADSRKLSDAKGAQIARQDAKLAQLEARAKELEAASAADAREASRSLKEAQVELEDAREEVKALRKSKATAKDAEAATEQLRKTRAVSIAQDKLDAEARVVREAGREVQQSRAKLETREAEQADARKTARDQANQRAAELERDLEGAKKDLAKALQEVKSARTEAVAARKDYQEKEIVLTTEMTRARGSMDQEKEKAARLKDEIEELRKRLGKAGELSEKESDLKAKWSKLDAEKKELADHKAEVASLEKGLEAREAAAKAAARTAADRGAEAEKALKEVRERERTLEKLERKIEADREKLEEQAKAKQQAHAEEIEELRKLLQSRDREIAKHEKEVESHQNSARAAADALA